MLNAFRNCLFLLALWSAGEAVVADPVTYYDVTIDTVPLVGHPAGPFYFEVAFIDGSGYGDGNNTATLTNFDFGGGNALGNPVVFGGASGSVENGVNITDTSFLNLFSEQFAPGIGLTFSLGLTSNDDLDGIPDGLTLYILDSSGVDLPTLAPSGGDYFLTAALGSSGAVFNVYGSDPSLPLSVGGPVSIGAPTVTSVPEPRTPYLLAGVLILMVSLKHRTPGSY